MSSLSVQHLLIFLRVAVTSILKSKNVSCCFYQDVEHKWLPCSALGRRGPAQEQHRGASQATSDSEMSPVACRFGDGISETQMSERWHLPKNLPLFFFFFAKCMEYIYMYFLKVFSSPSPFQWGLKQKIQGRKPTVRASESHAGGLGGVALVLHYRPPAQGQLMPNSTRGLPFTMSTAPLGQ